MKQRSTDLFKFVTNRADRISARILKILADFCFYRIDVPLIFPQPRNLCNPFLIFSCIPTAGGFSFKLIHCQFCGFYNLCNDFCLMCRALLHNRQDFIPFFSSSFHPVHIVQQLVRANTQCFRNIHKNRQTQLGVPRLDMAHMRGGNIDFFRQLLLRQALRFPKFSEFVVQYYNNPYEIPPTEYIPT